MIFGINTTRDISNCIKFEITYNNFEISLVVFMPNITTNHAITYTNKMILQGEIKDAKCQRSFLSDFLTLIKH